MDALPGLLQAIQEQLTAHAKRMDEQGKALELLMEKMSDNCNVFGMAWIKQLPDLYKAVLSRPIRNRRPPSRLNVDLRRRRSS
ncbi:hypothetical protein Q1695_015579 [Nippostrongylus brasiliensis]|nr:hypothetical protein Q1695_015579 [Nippostrongylus brasiliensis]